MLSNFESFPAFRAPPPASCLPLVARSLDLVETRLMRDLALVVGPSISTSGPAGVKSDQCGAKLRQSSMRAHQYLSRVGLSWVLSSDIAGPIAEVVRKRVSDNRLVVLLREVANHRRGGGGTRGRELTPRRVDDRRSFSRVPNMWRH